MKRTARTIIANKALPKDGHEWVFGGGWRKRDALFITGAMACWTMIMLVAHSRFEYFGTPPPSADLGAAPNAALRQEQIVRNSLSEMLADLTVEKDTIERKHIRHNIGTGYYDLYKCTRRNDFLDSARNYLVQALAGGMKNARFSYNLGRVYTEAHEFINAKQAYLQAIATDPAHVLALHNLGLLTLYELRRPLEARGYFMQALAVDSLLPMCNLVLGQISLDTKEYDQARLYLERELVIDNQFGKRRGNLPVDDSQVRGAQAMTYRDLALLYASRIVNPSRARTCLDAYLSLEGNPAEREAALREMNRYGRY